jgi:hypothetical protein
VPKLLALLATIFILLAFVLRVAIPENRFFPGGWPLESHWYRADWVAFWFFLIAGIVTGLAFIVKVTARHQALATGCDPRLCAPMPVGTRTAKRRNGFSKAVSLNAARLFGAKRWRSSPRSILSCSKPPLKTPCLGLWQNQLIDRRTLDSRCL